MSSMKERMHTGEIYIPDDEEIMSEQLKRLNKLYDFNMTRPTELDKREEMLKDMLLCMLTELQILCKRQWMKQVEDEQFKKNIMKNMV